MTSSPNTTEARPRGPNQPMKATVGARAPLPSRAIATGTMRTSVRLSAAYSTTCQVRWGMAQAIPAAPKPIQVTAASTPPASSVNRVDSEPCFPAKRPNAMPPTKAAMKTLPPSFRAMAIGQKRARQREDLPPLAPDPAAPAGDPQEQAAQHAGDHAGQRVPTRSAPPRC